MDRKRYQLPCDVTEAAKCRLQDRLDTDARKVSCEYENGVLVLHGRVSSFYYKQLAQEAVGGLPGVTEVINQIEVRTTMSKLVRDALGQIELPVANTAIRRRAVYRHSILYGRSVYEMGSKGRDAVEEIEQLIEEIKSL